MRFRQGHLAHILDDFHPGTRRCFELNWLLTNPESCQQRLGVVQVPNKGGLDGITSQIISCHYIDWATFALTKHLVAGITRGAGTITNANRPTIRGGHHFLNERSGSF